MVTEESVARFGPAVEERIIALTLAEPPGHHALDGARHGRDCGRRLSYAQRVWRSHGLQPHHPRIPDSAKPQHAPSSREQPFGKRQRRATVVARLFCAVE